MMNGNVTLGFGIPLEQREIGHPDKAIGIFARQPQSLSQMTPQTPKRLIGHLGGISNKQQQITNLGGQFLIKTGELLGAEKFGNGGLPALLRYLQPGQPFGAVDFDKIGKSVEILTRKIWTALNVDGFDQSAGSRHLSKHLEL